MVFILQKFSITLYSDIFIFMYFFIYIYFFLIVLLLSPQLHPDLVELLLSFLGCW